MHIIRIWNTMKHLLGNSRMFVILTLLAAFTFSGCQDAGLVSVAFDRAQCLMKENPDSALKLIKKITPAELGTEEQRARYALLYSQALDKNHIDVKSDSLIRVAVDYYKDKDDVWSRFHSCYYLARVYANANDLANAMPVYMEAESYVEELGDDYSTGLLYTQMGDIYYNYYDYPKALGCHQRATECYDRSGKLMHKFYAMMSQSIAYRNMNMDEESYNILCSVLAEARSTKTAQVVCTGLSNLVMLCVDTDRQKEAMAYYNELIRDYSIEDYNASFFAGLALLMAKEDLAMSDHYMTEAWKRAENSTDSITLYHTSSQIELMNASYEKAYHDLESCVSMQNIHVKEALQQPVVTAQKDFLDKELENKNRILRTERYIRFLLTVISLLTCVIVVFLMWKWFRRSYHRKFREKLAEWSSAHEQEMKKIRDEALEHEQSLRSYAAELKTKSELSQQDMKRLNQELENSREYIGHARMLLEQSDERIKRNIESQKADHEKYIRCMNRILKRSFKQIENIYSIRNTGNKNDETCRKAIDAGIHDLISEFYGSRKADLNLEQMVNECYDNVMEHQRQEICLPSEEYYRLACQLLAGMSVNLIASISDETANTIYKRREKIREIIKATDSNYKHIYALI